MSGTRYEDYIPSREIKRLTLEEIAQSQQNNHVSSNSSGAGS